MLLFSSFDFPTEEKEKIEDFFWWSRQNSELFCKLVPKTKNVFKLKSIFKHFNHSSLGNQFKTRNLKH
jgi:hypothetical protein